MILAVDIGNSNIMLGGFRDGDLSLVLTLATDIKRTADEYASCILSLLSLHAIDKAEITGAIMSSVVPPLNAVLKNAIRLLFSIDPLIVGPGIKTGLNIHCDTPSSVGADLICASVAACRLYTAPALIIDMGTATKMIIVNEKGAFTGVSILPGVSMGQDALAERTAQLPRVELSAPPSLIGKNTVDAIRSGVVFGNAAAVDGMIDRISDEFGAPLPVLATGGHAKSILPYCKHEITLDEHLVLRGLYILYEKNN